MTIRGNRPYRFHKIQNNLHHLSILSGSTNQSLLSPLQHVTKTSRPPRPIHLAQKSTKALSSKFRYIGEHASEAIPRDPPPRCQSRDGIGTRRIAYRACRGSPAASHAQPCTAVSTGSHSETRPQRLLPHHRHPGPHPRRSGHPTHPPIRRQLVFEVRSASTDISKRLSTRPSQPDSPRARRPYRKAGPLSMALRPQ